MIASAAKRYSSPVFITPRLWMAVARNQPSPDRLTWIPARFTEECSGHALEIVFLLPRGEMVHHVAGVSAHGEQRVR
jgi:hypothetical protein